MKRLITGILSICLLGCVFFPSHIKAVSTIQPQDDRDVTLNGNEGYLYGNAVILNEGTVDGRTLIYKDVNANGQIDTEDTPYSLSGAIGDTTEGYDLTNVTFYGLGNNEWPTIYDTHTGDVKITMLGGNIKEIIGSTGCENTGNFDLRMFGGKVERIMPAVTTKNMKWHGDINVVIGGDAEVSQAVYGASENNDALVEGNVNITIQDHAQIGGGTVYPKGVYAGGQQPNNTITGNTKIHITGGVISGKVSSDIFATKIQGTSKIIIDGGELEDVYGQTNAATKINDLAIDIHDGTIKGNVYNIFKGSNSEQTATLSIDGGAFSGQVINEGKTVSAVKSLDMNISGGTFHNIITLKQGTTAADPLQAQRLNISGSPQFRDTGYVMLRANEFITVPEAITSVSGSVRVKAPTDTEGTLIAKAKDNKVFIDSSKIALTNSALDLVNGKTKDDNHSLYLGTSDIQTSVTDVDFGVAYLDAPNVSDKSVTLSNTGNKALKINEITENENFSYSFDKQMLYPNESVELTVHIKKLPEISNNRNRQDYKKAETIHFENETETVEFDISMELVLSGTTNTETSDGWNTETDLGDTIEDLLNKEDKDALKEGSDITFKLFVEDANKTVANDVKELAKRYEEQQIGQYLDIYINKYIDKNVTAVTTLPKAINITIAIPKDLWKENRTFSVLRIHENGSKKEVDLLADLDTDEKTITFETDKFSTYVLLYKDKEVDKPVKPTPPVDNPDQPIVPIPPIENTSQPETPSKTDSVDTGDTSNLRYPLIIMLVAGGVLVVFLVGKQKKKLRK